MKRNIIALAFLMVAGLVYGDPPKKIVIDFSGSTAPAQQVYKANFRTFTVYLQNNGSGIDGSGQTPYMEIFSSNTSTGTVPAACSWSSQTTGVYTAIFQPSDLNTNGSWLYECGISSNSKPTTARQGSFVLISDPFASGVSAQSLTEILNWNLFTYLNTVAYGPYLAGSNITFRAGTNGQVYIDGSVGGGGGGDMYKATYDPLGVNLPAVFTNDSRLTDARTPLAHTQFTAGAGLTNAGTANAPTGQLNAASIASLSKADTSVQPDTKISASTNSDYANNIVNGAEVVVNGNAQQLRSADGTQNRWDWNEMIGYDGYEVPSIYWDARILGGNWLANGLSFTNIQATNIVGVLATNNLPPDVVFSSVGGGGGGLTGLNATQITNIQNSALITNNQSSVSFGTVTASLSGNATSATSAGSVTGAQSNTIESALQNAAAFYAAGVKVVSATQADTAVYASVANSASNLLSWPTDFGPALYTNSGSGSQLVAVANGQIQDWQISGNTTCYFPAVSSTNHNYGLTLNISAGASTFTINPANVFTNGSGGTSSLVFTNSGYTTLQCWWAGNANAWKLFTF